MKVSDNKIDVGTIGHVDHGKTTMTLAMSSACARNIGGGSSNRYMFTELMQGIGDLKRARIGAGSGD